MLKELKEKLDSLSEKYAKDMDVIALKALCTLPESEAVVNHAKTFLEKLEKKYSNIAASEEIRNLIPREKITLEELMKRLEEKYASDINFIMLKAMMNLEDSAEKEKSMEIYFKKINGEDEDIKKYFELKSSKLENEKQNTMANMILVEGGKYKPSFFDKEKEVFNIAVCKYLTTQDMYEKRFC